MFWWLQSFCAGFTFKKYSIYSFYDIVKIVRKMINAKPLVKKC